MAKLFISYSRKDVWAQELGRKLRNNEVSQHDVFVDYRDIHAGVNFWDVICDRIEDCDALIYVLSPDSVKSIYCLAEVRYALALNKPILPLMLRECEFPQFLNDHSINYRNVPREMSDVLLLIERSLNEFGRNERKNPHMYQMPNPQPARPPQPRADETQKTEIQRMIAVAREQNESEVVNQLTAQLTALIHALTPQSLPVASPKSSSRTPLVVAGIGIVVVLIIGIIAIIGSGGGGTGSVQATASPTTETIVENTPMDEPTIDMDNAVAMALAQERDATATQFALDKTATATQWTATPTTDITATFLMALAQARTATQMARDTEQFFMDITATAGALAQVAEITEAVLPTATAGALAQVAEITEAVLPTETPTATPTEPLLPTETPTETPTLEPLVVVITPSALIAQTGESIAIDTSINGEFSANSIPHYEWYMNGMLIPEPIGSFFNFNQATVGDYIVRVVIREMSLDGTTELRQGEATTTITVVSVDFIVEVPNPNKPLEVRFTPVLSDVSAFYTWNINADDIIESNDVNFTYTFPASGIYSVELTVNINDTDFKALKTDITVLPPPLSLDPITENWSSQVSPVVDDPTKFTVLACVYGNNCPPIPVLQLVINGAIAPTIDDFQQNFPVVSDARFTLENNMLMLMPGTQPAQVTIQSDAYGIGLYTFDIVMPAVVSNVRVESASTVTPYTNGAICDGTCDVSAIRYEVNPATPTTVELVFVATNNDVPVANAPVTVQFATIIAPESNVSQGALNIAGTDYAIPDPNPENQNNVYSISQSTTTNELGEVRVTLTLNYAYSEAFLTFSSDLLPETKWVRIQPLNSSPIGIGNRVGNTITSGGGPAFRVAGTLTTMINREVEQVLYIRDISPGVTASLWYGATYLWLRAEDISGTSLNLLIPDNSSPKPITSVPYCTVITCVPETATLTTFFPATTPLDTQFVELGRVQIAGAEYVFVQVVGDFND